MYGQKLEVVVLFRNKKIMPDFLGLQVVEVREQEKIMPWKFIVL